MTEAISIGPPLEGEWKFIRPPGHHPYAFDFVQLYPGRNTFHSAGRWRFIVGGIPSTHFYCWGKSVFSPIDGTVLRVGRGCDDHASTSIWTAIKLWYNATYRFHPEYDNGRLDIRPNAGNHVMIEAREGYIVFLAHLRNHSVHLAEGARVRKGDCIGEIGNSGNSTMPHLHINVFDQMDDPFQAKVLPFVFEHYQEMEAEYGWVEQKLSIPAPGSTVKFMRGD